MKQRVALTFFLLFMLLCFFACEKEKDESEATTESGFVFMTEVGAFSYAEDSKSFIPGQVGLKTDDFNNTEKQEIDSREDVLTLAKNEVTVSYNRTSVDYDKENDIWKVGFRTEYQLDEDQYVYQLGGEQYVYLNGDGTTKICVWWE